jgi:hypothetical protein
MTALLVLDPKERTIARYCRNPRTGPLIRTHGPVKLNYPMGADDIYVEALEQYRQNPESFRVSQEAQ